MKGKILFILSLSLFLFPCLAWGYQVTDIQAQDIEKETRITIVTDCPRYESFAVSGPDRLVIDLEADLLWPDSILVVNKGVVTKVWASPYRYADGRQVARVVIGLTQTTPNKIYKGDGGLVIDISHFPLKEVPEVEAPEGLPELRAEAPPEKIEKVSEKEVVEDHYLKGITYYKQAEYLKAIEEFKKVPPEAREYKKATKAIAKSQANLEKTLSEEERAAREVERVREELGKEERLFYEPYYTEALVHYNKGEWQKTVNACYKVLALDPEHKGAKEYLAKAKGELERIARLKREEERRERIKEYYTKGLDYYQKDRLDQAKEEFQQVLVLEPKHAGALDYLGRIEARYRLLEEERRERELALARERERKGRELTKKISDYFLAGKTLYEEGKLTDARLLFREVLKLAPQHKGAQEYLAKIEEEKEVKVIPGGAEEHYKQGLIEYNAGHLTRAIEEWNITLRLDPEHEKARIALERAEKELKKIQIAP